MNAAFEQGGRRRQREKDKKREEHDVSPTCDSGHV